MLGLACQAIAAYHNNLVYNATSPYVEEREKSKESEEELESDFYSQDNEFCKW